MGPVRISFVYREGVLIGFDMTSQSVINTKQE